MEIKLKETQLYGTIQNWYLYMLRKSIEGCLECQVYKSDEGLHDSIHIEFKTNVQFKYGNYIYEPSFIVFYNFIDNGYGFEVSSSATNALEMAYSMTDDGYGCGYMVSSDSEDNLDAEVFSKIKQLINLKLDTQF